MTSSERILEGELISKLQELKYTYREDIRDRATLEANFRSMGSRRKPWPLSSMRSKAHKMASGFTQEPL
jgi:hypothetical protein